MHVVMRASQADCTSDDKHDNEDDWETPEGDGNCAERKVLHIVQLLQTPQNCQFLYPIPHVSVQLSPHPPTHQLSGP